MAKSKNGGSRAMIRGRIGSDVYSIGKDGKGARQQVVRSLAVSVSNPRTQSQMVGRMLMSTIMQAVSELSPIIDHSFDGIAKGQPSISEFIRKNYAKIKNYYQNIADGDSGSFTLNKYQEKGYLPGSFVISSGEVAQPSATDTSASYGGFGAVVMKWPLQTEETDLTMAMVKEKWPWGLNDKITILVQTGGLDSFPAVIYQRVGLNLALADETVITAENVSSAFIVEGNTKAGFLFAGLSTSASGHIYVQAFDDPQMSHNGSRNENVVFIRSKYENGQWKHSDAEFNASNSDFMTYRTKETALATYPVGSERFLNGGEV